MNAQKIMTAGVDTLSKDHTLRDALVILKERRYRQIPIVDDDNKVLGVVTPRSLLRVILPGYISKGYLKDVKFAPELSQFSNKIEELGKKPICDIVDSTYSTVTPETSSMEVAALFVNAETIIESILVIDDDNLLLGIISPVDILINIETKK